MQVSILVLVMMVLPLLLLLLLLDAEVGEDGTLDEEMVVEIESDREKHDEMDE